MKSIAKTEEDSPKKPIWESLLERGSCKKEEIKNKIKEKEKKDEELDPECTFKPSLINQTQLQINKPFYERQKKWLDDRNVKINEKRDGAKDKILENCSFQPQLEPQQQIPEVDIRNTKGMDSFIQRQDKARKLKQEKNLLLNNPYSHLSSEKKAVQTNQQYISNNHPISKEYESIKKAERIEFSKAVEKSQDIETQSQIQQQQKMQLGMAMKMLHNQLYNIQFNSEF
ncbi:unnamed protein product [Paramecium primaurelia]|uniref:Uncharacterized protein n=1 Tax=Paramecium primaurelia TaxID=5886 RepID=A0A8S1LHM5_PARPR|nr:unnamed protein product [Paramecium primaurelia]